MNFHSLKSKLNDIKDRCINKNANVLCITKSWINPSIKEEVNIGGYIIYRHVKPERNYKAYVMHTKRI